MLDQIQRAMERAEDFMSLGVLLKAYGVKYEFVMLDMLPPHYRIGKHVVCSPKYADEDALIINGMALEV